MSSTSCQICGRRKPVRADGGIVLHYRRGLVCRGSGRLPFERDDAAIGEAMFHERAAADRHARTFSDHRERRLNEPLPATFWTSWRNSSREAARLEARLKRRARLFA